MRLQPQRASVGVGSIRYVMGFRAALKICKTVFALQGARELPFLGLVGRQVLPAADTGTAPSVPPIGEPGAKGLLHSAEAVERVVGQIGERSKKHRANSGFGWMTGSTVGMELGAASLSFVSVFDGESWVARLGELLRGRAFQRVL